MNARKHRNQPRGVVLLILLALLAMFGVVVLAFVVITGHSKRVATSFQRSEEYAIDPQTQLHHAFLEVARGSRSPTSCLRQHGLLEDMYGSRTTYPDLGHGVQLYDANGNPILDASGNPVFTAVVALASGQIIGFTPAHRDTYHDYSTTPATTTTLHRRLGSAYRYIGCVLTMTEGLAAGKSTRVVGYDSANNLLHVLPFKGVPSSAFVSYLQNNSGTSWAYIINGTPFSGSGFGYNDDPTTANVSAQALNAPLPIVVIDPNTPPDLTDWTKNDPLIVRPSPGGTEVPSLYETLLSNPNGGVPYALLPNRTGDPSNTATEGLHGSGHANEDYDAPDYQNMALAAVQENGVVPIPSYHRPALVNYWYHRVVNEWLVPVIGLTQENAWRAMLQPVLAAQPNPINPALPIIDARVRDAIVALKRRISFRPLADLHGYFSGSKAEWARWDSGMTLDPGGTYKSIFDPSYDTDVGQIRDTYWLQESPVLNGPWDVDNDGDGRPDSIWVDLGFPVRTESDGRRYKPLFAILCQDLGGRLNLNAHGSVAQTSPYYYRSMALVEVYESGNPVPVYDYRPGKIDLSPFALEFATVGNGNWDSSTNTGIVPLARGLGFGTADVNLMPLFAGFADPISEYSALLAKRYGSDGVPGAPGEDPLAWNKFFDYDFDPDRTDLSWYDYWGAVWTGTVPNGVFGTPYDLDGDGMVALDPGGRPLVIGQCGWNYVYNPDGSIRTYPNGHPMRVFELDEHPYQFNLAQPPNTDAPFTVNELERVLRPFDRDSAALPDRIAALGPGARNVVTTEQWDVPCPNPRLPHDLRATIGFDWQNALGTSAQQNLEGLLHASHVFDLLRARMYLELRAQWLATQGFANPDPLGTPTPPVPTPAQMNSWIGTAGSQATYSMKQLLAPELLAGLKMDLNRPFGNGRDDNGNGVIDEAEEAYPGSNRLNENGDDVLDAVLDQILVPGDPRHPLPDQEEYSGIGSYVEQFYQRVRDGSWAPNTFFDPTGGMDLNGDEPGDPTHYPPDPYDEYIKDLDRHLIRQVYARHLYALMMMVCDLEEMDRQWPSGVLTTAWPQPPSGISASQEERHNRRALTARKIAQWAANVVDFRDRDVVMTAFEYDIFPFTDASTLPPQYGADQNGIRNTWDVNGRLEQDGDTDDLFEDTLQLDRNQNGDTTDVNEGYPPPSPLPPTFMPRNETTPGDNARAYRGVVWGCERPELLISETLAFHDRRTQNLNADQAGAPAGQDPVWTSSPGPEGCDDDFDQLKMPQGSLYIELYNPMSNMEPGPMELYSAPNGGVDLTKVAVELNAAAPNDLTAARYWPVWRLLIDDGSTAPLDPDHPNTPAPTQPDPRAVYFVDFTAPQVQAAVTAGLDDQCNQYSRFAPDYSDSDVAVAPVLPGRYAVVGPGEKTGSGASAEYVTYIGTLDSTASTTAPFSDPSDNNQTRQIRLRPGYSANGSPVTVNPSGVEPAGARNGQVIQPIVGIPINYPNRLSISEPTQANPYPPYPPGQECYGDGVSTNTAYDTPFDLDATYDTGVSAAILAAKRTTGTTPQVCVVHLQRLANPIQGYNPNSNPYRTIDSASIDLSAFTGWWGNTTQQQDDSECTLAGMTPAVPMMFSSSQRGEDKGGSFSDQAYLGNNPWVQRLEQRDATSYPSITENPQTHFFVDFDPGLASPVARALQHSLGFLNEPFWPLRDDVNGATVGPYEGFPETRPDLPNAGDPARPPFPWLTWNNRPFVSQTELMMVPRVSSSRLLNAAIATTDGFFSMNVGTSPYNNEAAPFMHLWNFFYADDNGTPLDPTDDTVPQSHRLLDFVHVPSRFVGTELQGNPSAFTLTSETHPFRPPFSDIPNYREPGRVNINTIFSQRVWDGVMNYFPTGSPSVNAAYWDAMVANRRGYTPTAGMGNLNETSPTQFANPIRSYAGRDSVPVAGIYTGMQQEVNGTMLRSDLANGTGQPLFVRTTGNFYDEPNRNAYFRYQALQKLGNAITTRSNVYAVWITVGYFEVSEAYNVAGLPAAQFQGMFPEGYQLGPELGSDTGEVKRHRAFYVFDRSIPVGFERGRNNNVEEAILLQRFIE